MIAVITLLIELVMLLVINLGQNTSSISNVTASILILLFSFSFFVSVQDSRRLKPYRSSLMLGYFLRIFLLFLDRFGRNFYLLPYAMSDDDGFYLRATYLAQGYITKTGHFQELMGDVFRFIGINRLYGQFLCMLTSIVAILFLAYTLSILDISTEAKQRTFRIVCVLPNWAILTALFLREGLVAMFISMSVYFFVSWLINKRTFSLILAMSLIFPAAYFHSGAIALLVGYFIILILYDNKTQKYQIKASNIILALLLIIISTYFITQTEDSFLGKFSNLESIEDIANTNTQGGSSYARYVGNSNNPLNLIIYTVPRLFYFLFSPFPWQWRGISDIIAFVFSACYYFVAISSAIKLCRRREAENRTIVITLLIVSLAVWFVFAWGTSNTGTATRHRDKLITLVAVLWALGRDSKPLKRRKHRERAVQKSLNNQAVVYE